MDGDKQGVKADSHEGVYATEGCRRTVEVALKRLYRVLDRIRERKLARKAANKPVGDLGGTDAVVWRKSKK